MLQVNSYLYNPILTPEPKNSWESTAVYNGSVVKVGDKYLMVYRSLGNNLSTISIAQSSDGLVFNKRRQILLPEYDWEKYGLEDPRITRLDDKFYIFYTAISAASPGRDSIKVAVAITKDFISFEKHLVTPFNAKAMALFPQRINGQLVAILSANTDDPPSHTALAFFEKEDDIWDPTFWQKWYQDVTKNEIKLRRITTDHTEIGAVPIETKDGWLLIYSHIQDYFNGSYGTFGIEAVLLSKDNPQKIVGKTAEAIMVPQEKYELEGMISNIIFPSGALIEGSDLYIYYGAADNYIALATTKLNDLLTELPGNINFAPKLDRFIENPIISPVAEHEWESRATFNPAAILIDNKVHILYRAMSSGNTSVLGYAQSIDGQNISLRLDKPIYVPRAEFETSQSPGSFSGCEDPRITQIGDQLYMLYTAYDGHTPPKIAMTTISVNDFTSQNWSFTNPQIISDPSFDNKDGCLFPELINNQYVLLHREGGKGIMIDYVQDLEFKEHHLEGEACFMIGKNKWENAKMGIASPPLRTDRGWLLLYHGVSSTDNHYRVGAMLLKLDDPQVVIGRTKYPLFEPETDYEKYGEVNNVVFPCGAVIKNDQLFVYYGGADKVIGVATKNLNQILNSF